MDAVPALARVLRSDANYFVRQGVVSALRTLAVWNSEAILTLANALDDSDHRVQKEAVQSLGLLGERASDALPALRRLASSHEQTAAIRSHASEAVERILEGEPAYRIDEPYRTLDDAASNGRFTGPGVSAEARDVWKTRISTAPWSCLRRAWRAIRTRCSGFTCSMPRASLSCLMHVATTSATWRPPG